MTHHFPIIDRSSSEDFPFSSAQLYSLFYVRDVSVSSGNLMKVNVITDNSIQLADGGVASLQLEGVYENDNRHMTTPHGNFYSCGYLAYTQSEIRRRLLLESSFVSL